MRLGPGGATSTVAATANSPSAAWEQVFLIGLALIAGTGVAFFLFVIEPRRKIYDYDPSDLR